MRTTFKSVEQQSNKPLKAVLNSDSMFKCFLRFMHVLYITCRLLFMPPGSWPTKQTGNRLLFAIMNKSLFPKDLPSSSLEESALLGYHWQTVHMYCVWECYCRVRLTDTEVTRVEYHSPLLLRYSHHMNTACTGLS